MATRKYSIDELNRMRRAILRMLPPEVAVDENQIGLLVESRLHTYVMNGTDPDELEQSSKSWDVIDDGYFLRDLP